jgi:hypothetical protein
MRAGLSRTSRAGTSADSSRPSGVSTWKSLTDFTSLTKPADWRAASRDLAAIPPPRRLAANIYSRAIAIEPIGRLARSAAPAPTEQ